MKICFWGDVAGALRGKTNGGGELQIALLAKALAISGHEVVIIDPFSNESFVTAEGVKLFSVPDFNKGYRGLRLFGYRLPALWKIFREQKADYYYIRMRFYLHLIPYFAAKRTGGKLIQAIASDLDVLGSGIKFKYAYKANFDLWDYLTVRLPSDLVFSYLLKKSDLVLLQHSGQKVRSTSKNGKVVIFPNIINSRKPTIVGDVPGDYFIHVGTLSILKGADKLYQLIKSLDRKHTFIIVGQPRDSKSKAIFKNLAEMENVVLKGRLDHNETMQLISNAKALINTSYYEGFPNIFLEAWSAGVPVISLKVNPGDIFNKFDLGICCEGDLEKMKVYMESDETIHFDRDKSISYVCDFHDFNTAGERFFNIINNA